MILLTHNTFFSYFSLTFNVAVDDFECLVEVVQGLKELVGVVEGRLGREWTVFKHVSLQTTYGSK